MTSHKQDTWFEDVLKSKMQWFIDAIDLPPGVADNAALQENVFMMIVCVLNEVAIMVVGKPGSSKTLATQLITTALNRSTKSELFHRCHFNSIEFFTYQCSQHSTARDIEETFRKATERNEVSGSATTSVVLLDEVGLAENTEAMPLKVLHKLLEKPEVAFIGLSNWQVRTCDLLH